MTDKEKFQVEFTLNNFIKEIVVKNAKIKELELIIEFLKNKKGIIIDLGCGNGRNMIGSKDIFYYGVDFSSIQLKHAEYKIKKEKINAKLFKSRADKLDKKIFLDNKKSYLHIYNRLEVILFSKALELMGIESGVRSLESGVMSMIKV